MALLEVELLLEIEVAEVDLLEVDDSSLGLSLAVALLLVAYQQKLLS